MEKEFTGRSTHRLYAVIILMAVAGHHDANSHNSTVTAKIGESCILPCLARLNTPVDWYYTSSFGGEEKTVCLEGEPVNGYRCRFRVNFGDYNLTIDEVQLSDAGTYKCVENVGIGLEHYVQLTVSGIYRSHITRMSKAVVRGCEAQLTCHGIPSHATMWQKQNGSTMDISERLSPKLKMISLADDTSQLVIKNVSSADGGTYRCHQKGVNRTDKTREMELFVVGNFARLNRIATTIGNQLTIVCNTKSSSKVEWRHMHRHGDKAKQLHSQSDKYRYGNLTCGLHYLQLLRVDMSDSGLYACLEPSGIESSVVIAFTVVSVTERYSCINTFPEDQIVNAGSNVILSATTRRHGDPQWSRADEIGRHVNILSNQGPIIERYGIIKGHHGQADLVIKTVTMKDAGTYIFRDEACGEQVTARIVVLDTLPACHKETNSNRETIFNCSVNFNGQVNFNVSCLDENDEHFNTPVPVVNRYRRGYFQFQWTVQPTTIAYCNLTADSFLWRTPRMGVNVERNWFPSWIILIATVTFLTAPAFVAIIVLVSKRQRTIRYQPTEEPIYAHITYGCCRHCRRHPKKGKKTSEDGQPNNIDDNNSELTRGSAQAESSRPIREEEEEEEQTRRENNQSTENNEQLLDNWVFVEDHQFNVDFVDCNFTQLIARLDANQQD